MKKRLLSLLLTGALCLSLSAPALAAGLENFQKTNTYTAGQFTDVPAGEWYAANVQAAYELGLMEGSSETTFNPSGNLTIAEALVLACRLHSTYVGDGATFAGSGGAWYQPYVDYAVETAILSPGTYSDYTATATRAQFASILAAALPAEALTAINSVTALPDVAADAAYAPAVLSLYNAGVLTGSDAAGSFKPDTTIQRSEVATIVTRMADPSLRKTFTLTTGETTQPEESASSTKRFDGPITAEDLQGAWHPTDSNWEVEYNFDGNQFIQVEGSQGEFDYKPGTFTVTSTPDSANPNLLHVTVAVTFGTCYTTDAWGAIKSDDFWSNDTSDYEFDVDLSLPEDQFVMTNRFVDATFVRAEEATLLAAWEDTMGQTGVSDPYSPKREAYDFLANYIQTEGEVALSGDYVGQYECWINLYGQHGPESGISIYDQRYYYNLYFDPDSGDITLCASYHHRVSSTPDSLFDRVLYMDYVNYYTLVIPQDLTHPYTFTFWNRTAERGGTAYLSPDNYSLGGEIIFDTHEGYDQQYVPANALETEQGNSQGMLLYLLASLRDEILSPNGYTLDDLGIKTPS